MEKTDNSNYRFNFLVNVIDGGFFGLALGFSSTVSVLPLFVNTLTDSAALIGLIPAIHVVGWQFPQLLTAERVTRLRRYKPMVMLITLNERLPFFGLALLAWFIQDINPTLALVLIYFLLVWLGFGGGFAATAWQSMIGKIIPSKRHGSFFGTQAAVANMLSGIGAVSAGFILERLPSPQDFTLAFILTGVAMMISLAFLALTREHESEIEKTSQETSPFWSSVKFILRRDHNFRFFMLGRILFQFAAMAFAFYAIYGVNELGMSEVTAGLMAGVFSGVQIIANPILGGIGDRWGHQQAMIIGIIAATLSAFIAWWAPSATWFFVVFFLAGIANVSLWTISIAMSLRFGGLDKRPAYIGLTNTLVAPFTFLAPIIGGWLVDISGYALTFSLSGIVGIVALMMFVGFVRNPKP